MQPSRKSFSMHTDAFSVTTTYQPAHVLFQVQDKRTNKLKLSLLEDATLPQNIREECEEVSGLYEFLSGKSPQEIEVDEGTLKFKVVHIRKERWYSLDLQDQQAPEMMEEEGHSSSEVQKLQLQIRELREEISRLQALNNNNYKFQQPRIPQATVPLQISQPITYEKVSKLLQLTPNFACKGANSHYAVADRLVTKCTDGQSLLIFEERIKEERVHFSITVDSELTNNWIIFGAITEQYREDDWCYFEQNCIAFSGSMGIIYNGLDVIDLNISLRVGSCIRLQIDPHSQVAEWTIDGVLVSRHKMRVNIELGLYPYLMLAHAGDRVLLGSE